MIRRCKICRAQFGSGIAEWEVRKHLRLHIDELWEYVE